MSGKGNNNRQRRYNKNRKNDVVVGDTSREVMQNIDENSPVMVMFQQYAAELDSKHDRYERIVKISRDITIESKRIIFLLHNIDRDDKREKILQEAEQRLTTLITNFFKTISLEIENQDPYQYLRAYTAGLEEFIEAYTFFQYLQKQSIDHYSSLQNQLKYTEDGREISTLLSPVEFLLGVGDLTGELMRKCINNLSTGNITGCFQTCDFVRSIYTGFLGLSNNVGWQRKFGRKCTVTKQSLAKMELVCYNIVVRGSEIPKHMLAAVVTRNEESDSGAEDEGFY